MELFLEFLFIKTGKRKQEYVPNNTPVSSETNDDTYTIIENEFENVNESEIAKSEILTKIESIKNSENRVKKIASNYSNLEKYNLFSDTDNRRVDYESESDYFRFLERGEGEDWSWYTINKAGNDLKYHHDYLSEDFDNLRQVSDVEQYETIYEPPINSDIKKIDGYYMLTESGDLYKVYFNSTNQVDDLEQGKDKKVYFKKVETSERVLDFTSLTSSTWIADEQALQINAKLVCLLGNETIATEENDKIVEFSEDELLNEKVFCSLGDYFYYPMLVYSGDVFEGLYVKSIDFLMFGDNTEARTKNWVGTLGYQKTFEKSYDKDMVFDETEYLSIESIDEEECILNVKDSEIISKIKYYIDSKESEKTIILEVLLKNGKTVYFEKDISIEEMIEKVDCEYGFNGIPEQYVISWDERGGKPIIYLYPEKETQVKVKLPYSDRITVSYPEYKNGWNVIAKPNGDLYDVDTKKNLYALYYECLNMYDFNVLEDGFVIKGKDIAEFLEEKLSILGLNDREREEFIIYWLPKLCNKKYLYIRFGTTKEIENNMPLVISPKPDNMIRVWMTYKEIEEPMNIKEQYLKPVDSRDGFTAVEWGVVEMH